MSKKVNLARVIQKNKKCLGFAFRVGKNRYEYQNDNDLGLDLEGCDCIQRYNRKIYVGNGYYYYLMWGNFEGDIKSEGVTLSMVTLLLKECHSQLFSFNKREQNRLDRYWKELWGE